MTGAGHFIIRPRHRSQRPPNAVQAAQGGGGLGPDEPAYGGVGAVIIGDSNNSRYASATAAGALPLSGTAWFAPQSSPVVDGFAVDTTRASIITGKDGNGLAMSTHYFNQGTQQGNHWTATNVASQAASKTNYWRCQMRFRGTAPTSAAFAIKFCILNMSGQAGGANPQWSTHDQAPYSSSSGKTTFWQFYDQAFTDSGSAYPTGHDQGTQPFGPYFQDLFDGNWHRFTFAYKTHTSAGNKDGFARMWVDGTKIVDVESATIGVTPAGGEKQWCGSEEFNGTIEIANSTASPYGVTFHGTESTLNTPAVDCDINLGDNDPTNLNTFVWWAV